MGAHEVRSQLWGLSDVPVRAGLSAQDPRRRLFPLWLGGGPRGSRAPVGSPWFSREARPGARTPPARAESGSRVGPPDLPRLSAAVLGPAEGVPAWGTRARLPRTRSSGVRGDLASGCPPGACTPSQRGRGLWSPVFLLCRWRCFPAWNRGSGPLLTRKTAAESCGGVTWKRLG